MCLSVVFLVVSFFLQQAKQTSRNSRTCGGASLGGDVAGDEVDLLNAVILHLSWVGFGLFEVVVVRYCAAWRAPRVSRRGSRCRTGHCVGCLVLSCEVGRVDFVIVCARRQRTRNALCLRSDV